MFNNIQYLTTLNGVDLDSSKKYLVLSADQNYTIFEELKNQNIEFYGAIFPQVIFNYTQYSKGFLLLEASWEISFDTITNIQTLQTQTLVDLTKKLNSSKSIMLFIDGLSSFIQSFLEQIYEMIHKQTKVIGGGAGFMSFEQKPVIFDRNGIYEDAALIVSLPHTICLGVDHGWEKLQGPYVASLCEKNILKTVDYKSAFEFYQDVIFKDSSKKIDQNNFFNIAKNYPIGIEQHDGRIIVRDPVAVDGENLILVGEIDQNSIIYVLKGNLQNLLEASKNAAFEANNCQNNNCIIVIDCISRSLYLRNDFSKELQNIKSVSKIGMKNVGVLSLGEIANNNNNYIEFYNKTCVVGTI